MEKGSIIIEKHVVTEFVAWLRKRSKAQVCQYGTLPIIYALFNRVEYVLVGDSCLATGNKVAVAWAYLSLGPRPPPLRDSAI